MQDSIQPMSAYIEDDSSDEIIRKKISVNLIYFAIKRVFDIICAIIGIIALIPISIIIKIAYLIQKDTNSIFYTQERIGKNGKLFKLYKFRTMIPNADEVLNKLLTNDKKMNYEYRVNKKLRNDPRITKVGKILRKTSIDELPQAINILLGHMAVIGNRPYLPREKKEMKKYYSAIVSTKPGLTGYWQVSGRNDMSFKRRLVLEKYYSEHCNIFMDIGIFFRTFKVVFFGRGAK